MSTKKVMGWCLHAFDGNKMVMCDVKLIKPKSYWTYKPCWIIPIRGSVKKNGTKQIRHAVRRERRT